jgi:hypothetical protein
MENTWKKILKEIAYSFLNKFGIFGIFLWLPYYLLLLNFYEGKSLKIVSLNSCFKLFDKIFKFFPIKCIRKSVFNLLKPLNWRPHLIACIAIIKMKKKDQVEFIKILWYKCEAETSWVAPQMLVTLSFIDLNFKEKAQKILKDENASESIKNEISVLLNLKNEFSKDKTLESSSFFWRKKLEVFIQNGKI